MKTVFTTAALLFSLLILISCGRKSQDEIFMPGNGPYLEEIAENLYYVHDFNNGGNICFLVSKTGVLVVDAGYYPGPTSEVSVLIDKVTSKPVKYIVYTHCHTDHVGGVAGWPETAEIIAHENLPANLKKFVLPGVEEFRDELEKFGEDSLRQKYGDLFREKYSTEIKQPGKLFSEAKIIKLGKYTVELHYPGVCHTTDNILVWFPAQKAVHTGDLIFNGRHPFISKTYQANVINWIETLKKWSEKDIEAVIPGHGEPGGKDLLIEQADYLTLLVMAVEEYVGSENDINQVAAEIHGEYFQDYEYSSYFNSAVELVMLNLAEQAQ